MYLKTQKICFEFSANFLLIFLKIGAKFKCFKLIFYHFRKVNFFEDVGFSMIFLDLETDIKSKNILKLSKLSYFIPIFALKIHFTVINGFWPF